MIDEIAKAEGVTLAEVVRRARDAYLSAERDAEVALASTFGVDPGAAMAEPRRVGLWLTSSSTPMSSSTIFGAPWN